MELRYIRSPAPGCWAFNSPRVLLEPSNLKTSKYSMRSFQFSQSLIGTPRFSLQLMLLRHFQFSQSLIGTYFPDVNIVKWYRAFNSPRVLLERGLESRPYSRSPHFQFSQSLIGTRDLHVINVKNGLPFNSPRVLLELIAIISPPLSYCSFNSPRVLLEPDRHDRQFKRLKQLSILPESYWNAPMQQRRLRALRAFNSPRVLLELFILLP